MESGEEVFQASITLPNTWKGSSQTSVSPNVRVPRESRTEGGLDVQVNGNNSKTNGRVV